MKTMKDTVNKQWKLELINYRGFQIANIIEQKSTEEVFTFKGKSF